MDAVESMGAPIAAPRRASLSDALRIWAHVSVAGIGGPALQIATMHRLLVEGRHWISEKRFYHALGYCIALPGPETQQLAVYVGWLAHRTTGGIVAGSLFILPGAVCMMILSIAYVTGAESQVGQAVILGVKPAILAVMTEAILRFGRHVLRGRLMVAIAALAFIAAFLKIAFPIIVLGAALIGAGAEVAGVSSSIREKVPDQGQRELPNHTSPSMVHFVRSLTMWLALWLAPMIALFAIFGPQNVYTQISFVFGKVAVTAIGGDFAVVVYAAQQAVDSYHWVSSSEMQDAIAMGEMVPGTIMIVTQFLGFMTAYRDPGTLPPLLAGGLGGLLATWMTFAPCFLMIMVVAPYIEGLRSRTFLNSTLRSVTAAAVGMLVSLSVWFAIRTMFHHIEQVHNAGFTFDMPNVATLDPWALVLFIVAAISLLRFKFSPAVTLVTSAAIGAILLAVGLAK
jgi:chromate transporter